MPSKLAPITIFAYRRVDLLHRVIESLLDNIYARESDIFFYLDGSRGEHDREEVDRVREYVRSIEGFNKVTVIERNRNYGLARNIIEGVTDIVNEYGKIIVLEDDILTCRYFLKYMNDALDLYENENTVMEISGYAFPHGNESVPETAFIHFADCWGWATWRRAWNCFEKDPEGLINSFSKDDIFKFNFDGCFPFWNQVMSNASGQLDTWAVFWQASVYKKNGLMLYPTKSLIKNIGLDGSGENCGVASGYNSELVDKPIEVFPTEIEENAFVRKLIGNYLAKLG